MAIKNFSAFGLQSPVWALLVVAFVGMPIAHSQTRPTAGESTTISVERFETLQKLIKPQPGEWRFAEIPWSLTVAEARKKAAEEGKPLFIWYMVGEPLGQC